MDREIGGGGVGGDGTMTDEELVDEYGACSRLDGYDHHRYLSGETTRDTEDENIAGTKAARAALLDRLRVGRDAVGKIEKVRAACSMIKDEATRDYAYGEGSLDVAAIMDAAIDGEG